MVKFGVQLKSSNTRQCFVGQASLKMQHQKSCSIYSQGSAWVQTTTVATTTAAAVAQAGTTRQAIPKSLCVAWNLLCVCARAHVCVCVCVCVCVRACTRVLMVVIECEIALQGTPSNDGERCCCPVQQHICGDQRV